MSDMLKTDKGASIFMTGALAMLYSTLALLYFNLLDTRFYIRNIFKNDISICVPFIYFLLVAIFIFLYATFIKKGPGMIAYPVLAMAMILSLVYYMTDLKVGMLTMNPFHGNRGTYGIYAQLYLFFFIALFSVSAGLILRIILNGAHPVFLPSENAKAHAIVFHAPIFIFFAFIETAFFLEGLVAHTMVFLALFILFLFFDNTAILFKKTGAFLMGFARKETFFLTVIFLAAFLIRYFWGLRLIAMTGDRFVMASDDGMTYDPFAAMIAQGEMMPKSEVFYWSGFGYWHFLAAIYRVFGLHNFKAMVVVQSLLGATVPIFTYLIGKRVFKSRLVGMLGALMTSINLTLVFLAVVIGMEAVYIPLFMLALTLTAYFLTDKNFNYKKAFVIGCAFGLTNNTRSEVLLFPLILVFFMIFFMKESQARKKAIAVGALFAGFILLMSIQHIATYLRYGEYRLTSGALGVTFGGYYGTGENVMLDGMGFNPFKDAQKTLSVFLNNPREVFGLVSKGFVKRVIIFYFKPNFGVFDPTYLVNPASGYFFRYPLWVQFYEYIFIILGITTAIKSKERLVMKAVMLAFPIYLSSMYGFIWVTNSRHRGVIIPIFVLFFAYGVKVFYERVKCAYTNDKRKGIRSKELLTCHQ